MDISALGKLATLVLLACTGLLWSVCGSAQGLVDRPTLVLDPGMHVAPITRLDVDAAGRTAVTASVDGTLRLWDTANGALRRTIRLPLGVGNIGKPYSVAISGDGSTIAAGGWMRFSSADPQEQVYLFDAATGAMLERIDGLPNVVFDLAFSPDGNRLAMTLGGGFGMRLYRRAAQGWEALGGDSSYGERSHGVAFAPDGRIATTAYDGRVRLYDTDGGPLGMVASGGGTPFGVAFSPDGARLAVGFFDAPRVRLFDAATLDPLPGPDTERLGSGDLAAVAWSLDGDTLYAAGKHQSGEVAQVVAWDEHGSGGPRTENAASNTVVGLRPLPGSDLIVASGDPWIARLAADGETIWQNPPRQMDARDQHANLAISEDGSIVEFGYSPGGAERVRFDVAELALDADPPDNGLALRPVQNTLAVTDWNDSYDPRLLGRPLGLEPYESSRSLAIEPGGDSFLLGTEWFLRAFDRNGSELWRREAPGVVWAVNISGDGRLALAAYGDGTLRWRRLEDGVEILALFPLPDRRNWVAWTPEGVYAASSGARSVLRWHVNRGWDEPGAAIPVSEIPQTLRPEVIRHVLPQLGTAGAIAVAELGEIRQVVQTVTQASVAPGARLHVLAAGVAKYSSRAAHLDLEYADDDAADLATAVLTSQTGLYAEVRPQILRNETATRAGILRALASLREDMMRGHGGDLALVHFSGHGAIVDDMFYLLPHDVDASDPVSISETALDVARFQREIALIARYGRVIVLLDACRSGATTSGGTALATDADRLAELMRAPNISVLTSSSAEQNSVESAEWGNGAFTEAVLEALTTRADADRNGVITMVEMTRHVAARVPQITAGRQTPGIDMRFESSVFVAGL